MKQAGLMQSIPSGVHCARVKVKDGGKGIVKRASLETDVLTTAKVVRHSRKIVFQMAEVAMPRELFRDILRAIERL